MRRSKLFLAQNLTFLLLYIKYSKIQRWYQQILSSHLYHQTQIDLYKLFLEALKGQCHETFDPFFSKKKSSSKKLYMNEKTFC